MSQMLPSTRSCTHCGTSISCSHPSYIGDTFATKWTDGFCSSLRFSRDVRILWKCPSWQCGKLSWQDEMGKGDPDKASSATISFDNYYQFANALLKEGDEDSAFQALLLGLWEVNGMMRAISHSNYFVTSFIAFRHRPKVSELIGRLETLLDLSVPADTILAAEMAREHGRFDRAIEILKSLNSDDEVLGKFSNVIRDCAERQLPIVRPVPI